MSRSIPGRLCAAVVLAGAATGHAAESAQPSPTLVVGEVLVRGQAGGPVAPKNVFTSVDVLGGSLVTDANVNNSWELFNRLPGTMVTEFRQGTTSGKFSLRGFNGEGEINAVKLLIDGVPSNSNDGNMPYLDMIFPTDIAGIEVVRGTNDPRYGLHNIAGNANVSTRAGGNYGDVRASYGSFASRDVQAGFGIEKDGLSQNYFVGFRNTQGYRDHAQSEKATFSGKWFYGPDDGRYRVGLIARHYWNSAQEPGYLTLADARRDPGQSYGFTATDGGERLMNQVSAHLDADLGRDLYFTAKAYLNRIEDQRWVKFSAGVSQQERIVDETHYGVLSTLTWRAGKTALGNLSVEGGLSVERQENKSLRYNTIDRVRQAKTRDQDFDFDIAGVYAQAVLEPVEKLRIVPAFRVDSVGGAYVDNRTGVPAAVNDYGLIRQPKLSVIYALTDTASVYANWGRTFQVGVGAGAYKVTRTTDLRPSINQGWEFGVKLNPAPWLDGRIAVWQQTASDEARRKLNDPANDAENVGRTKRRGLDVQVNAKPGAKTGVWVAYSYQDSEITQADAALPASQGKEIDHIPHHLLSSGGEWQVTPELRLSAWLNAQTNYYLERANTAGTFGGYVLGNVGASWQVAKDVALDVQVKNITNRYYEYVWHDGTQSLHSPGDPRALYAAVHVRF